MRFWLYLLICSLVFTNVSFCSTYDVIYRTSADPVTRSISVSPSDLDIVYSTSKDSGYVYTTSTEPDYTNKISQESHSTGSYYVGSQGPAITIEKYTNGFKNNYKKNDIITVKIRIINNNK